MKNESGRYKGVAEEEPAIDPKEARELAQAEYEKIVERAEKKITAQLDEAVESGNRMMESIKQTDPNIAKQVDQELDISGPITKIRRKMYGEEAESLRKIEAESTQKKAEAEEEIEGPRDRLTVLEDFYEELKNLDLLDQHDIIDIRYSPLPEEQIKFRKAVLKAEHLPADKRKTIDQLLEKAKKLDLHITDVTK